MVGIVQDVIVLVMIQMLNVLLELLKIVTVQVSVGLKHGLVMDFQTVQNNFMEQIYHVMKMMVVIVMEEIFQ